MDFHSLSRRELQALCKKNKIPANMTNVAMADALTALDQVEGLGEFLNAPPSENQQSPPRTACRASSRRKPALAEPESSQPLTRTRRTTRRAVAEEADQETKNEPLAGPDQENVNANLLETPAIAGGRRRGRAVSVRKKTELQSAEGVEETMVAEGKKDLLETPAVNGSRTCAKAGSTRNTKTKKEEKSVRSVYSTRRSFRLLEKDMEALSLKEEEKAEVHKADGCCNNDTEEIEEEKNVSGIDVTGISVQNSGNNSDSKLCQNLAKSLDNESEPKQVPLEADEESECNGADCFRKLSVQHAGEASTEESNHAGHVYHQPSEEVSKENKGIESEIEDATAQEFASEKRDHSAKDEGIKQSSDEKVGVQSDSLDKPKDIAPESTDAFETDDSNEPENGPEECTGLFLSKTDGETGGHHGNLNELDTHESENMKNATDINYESSNKNEPEVFRPVIRETQVEEDSDENQMHHQVQELDILESGNMESSTDINHESSDKKEPEVLCPVIRETQVEEVPDENQMHQQIQEVEENPEEVQQHSAPSPQYLLNHENSASKGETELAANHHLNDNQSAGDPGTVSVECNDEALVDVPILEDDNFAVPRNKTTPAAVANQVTLFCPSGDEEDQTLIGVTVEQAEEFGLAPAVPASPLERPPAAGSSLYHALASSGGGGGISSRSPFAADTIQGQFPRPTGSATRKSSALKKQIKAEMIADAAIDIVNKENINSLNMEEEKVKKGNCGGELEKMSLTQLRKMVKELTISQKKNTEEENGIKGESKRVALQALPDN